MKGYVLFAAIVAAALLFTVGTAQAGHGPKGFKGPKGINVQVWPDGAYGTYGGFYGPPPVQPYYPPYYENFDDSPSYGSYHYYSGPAYGGIGYPYGGVYYGSGPALQLYLR